MSAADPRALRAQHFVLAQLTPDELDRVVAMAGERQFTGGKMIFQKGDPGTSLMAVLSGRVRISAFSEDGKEVILNIIEAGQVFGEVGAARRQGPYRRRHRDAPRPRSWCSAGASSSRSSSATPR